MDLSVLSCLDGAKNARGIAVIIDVFRASNTIIAALTNGAECVIPVGPLDDAYSMKKRNSGFLLFGERKGLPPKGFDGGNSPALMSKLDLNGRSVILTTMAGSKGIVNASKADEIIIGSFANADAVAEYIRAKKPKLVSVVPMGLESHTPALEDELCALLLKDRIEGRVSDYDTMVLEILSGDGASRLRSLKQEDDLDYCMRLNISDIVPVYEGLTGRIIAVKKK